MEDCTFRTSSLLDIGLQWRSSSHSTFPMFLVSTRLYNDLGLLCTVVLLITTLYERATSARSSIWNYRHCHVSCGINRTPTPMDSTTLVPWENTSIRSTMGLFGKSILGRPGQLHDYLGLSLHNINVSHTVRCTSHSKCNDLVHHFLAETIYKNASPRGSNVHVGNCLQYLGRLCSGINKSGIS